MSAAIATSNGNVHHSYPSYLVSPDPFVILADSAAATPVERVCFQTGAPPPDATYCETRVPSGDVLGRNRQSIRMAETVGTGRITGAGAPLWPCGLAFDLAGAGVLLAAAVQWTTTPIRRLQNGVRLA